MAITLYDFDINLPKLLRKTTPYGLSKNKVYFLKKNILLFFILMQQLYLSF